MPRDIEPASIDIRAAAPMDWPAVEALLSSLALPLAGARDHLATMMVGIRQGLVIACAGLECYGSDGLLRSVAVAAPCQGQGIGRLLVDAMVRQACRQGITHLWLLTTTAPDYFGTFGFRTAERADVPDAMQASAEFQGACPASAHLMTLPLPSVPIA